MQPVEMINVDVECFYPAVVASYLSVTGNVCKNDVPYLK